MFEFNFYDEKFIVNMLLLSKNETKTSTKLIKTFLNNNNNKSLTGIIDKAANEDNLLFF